LSKEICDDIEIISKEYAGFRIELKEGETVSITQDGIQKFSEILLDAYLGYLKECLKRNLMFNEDFSLIFRPSFGESPANIAIRFKRENNDGF
jgi:hypothetical protein